MKKLVIKNLKARVGDKLILKGLDLEIGAGRMLKDGEVNNVVLGYYAGDDNYTGNYNILIGSN